MKTICLILIPCICLGMAVPSGGVVACSGRLECSPTTHYGGQAIQVQAIDPRYLQGMTREQLVWFVIIGLAVSIWCLETNG